MQIKARGVIINNEGNIFLCKLKKEDFFCLPGGTLEEGELIQECLEREIMEELGVTPIVGEMIYVNDFIRKKNGESVVDLRYEILNPNDFFQIDLESASHGFENSEVGFYDLSTISKQYQPENMGSILLNKKSHQ